jgi:hypothetical protein
LNHKPKAFLICPVRGHDMSELQDLVKQLEEHFEVHWPHRDTNQDDPHGFMICLENKNAIRSADIIFVIWDGKSEGGLIDIGMALMAEKPVKIISLPDPTVGKSVQNMVREWEKSCSQIVKKITGGV